MRTRRLCAVTLAVLAVHLVLGWCVATRLPEPALARAGVRWFSQGIQGRSERAIAVALVRPALPEAPAEGDPPAQAQAKSSTSPKSPNSHPHLHTRSRTQPHTELQARARADTPTNSDAGATIPTREPLPSAALPPTAGDAGREVSSTSDAPAWPIYPTRVPPSATIRYILVQQAVHRPPVAASDTPATVGRPGTAEVEWQVDSAGYHLRVIHAGTAQPAHEWDGTGAIGPAGVAPRRLAERDRGRDKRAINFDADGQRVRFSASTQALALAPGAQDRWSWMVQLAAIAEAACAAGAGPPSPGTVWDIQVAGLRGELDRWRFRVLAESALPVEAGAVAPGLSSGNDALNNTLQAPALLHVLREPERPYDLRIEVWLSPSLHHLPIGLRMSAPPGAWSLALWPPPAGS